MHNQRPRPLSADSRFNNNHNNNFKVNLRPKFNIKSALTEKDKRESPETKLNKLNKTINNLFYENESQNNENPKINPKPKESYFSQSLATCSYAPKRPDSLPLRFENSALMRRNINNHKYFHSKNGNTYDTWMDRNIPETKKDAKHIDLVGRVSFRY
jgi:hypothetical protein